MPSGQDRGCPGSPDEPRLALYRIGVREAQKAVSQETGMRCFKCGKRLSLFAGTVCPSCHRKAKNRTIFLMAFLCAVGGFCLGLILDGIGLAVGCMFCGMLLGATWGASAHPTPPPQQIDTAHRYPHDYADKLTSQDRPSGRRDSRGERSKSSYYGHSEETPRRI